MSTILLQTKLYIPVTRNTLIGRPRLIQRLNDGLNGRLALISAPAGFGKTTLIAAWGAQLTDSGRAAFTWLALDDNDNDVIRFFTYFITALKKIDSRIGQTTFDLLQAPQPHNQLLILTDLLNNLAATNQQIVLVLDDYHLINNSTIHSGIEFLITHAPPNFYMLLITRADPPFSLVKLRVRHQVTEIRQDDLRFSPVEAADFLNQLMALDLPETAITTLEQRTEGWIAGLQMAALSLQGHSDQAEFIRTFTGSHRYIFDYLAEEVLAHRPHGTQEFLLKTAILERLTAPLCDALLERSDSQNILEELEAANLFLVPLDDTRHWYRYHHLFGDLLRQFLRREMADQEITLHSRASRWFETAGHPYDAIEHALKADELKRAAALMEPLTHSMAYRMENERLGRWIRALPDDLLMDYPGIVFPYAVTLSATNQIAAYEAYLGKMERAAQENIGKPAAQYILCQVGILKCIRLHMQGEYEQALIAVKETEVLLRQYNQLEERWELISIVGYALNHVIGNGAEAVRLQEKAIRLGTTDDGSIGATLCHTFMGNTLIRQGKLRQAAVHLNTAAQAAIHDGQPQLHAVFPAALQAIIHYKQNQLDLTAEQLNQYLPLSTIAGFTTDPVDSVFVYVMLPLAQGDADSAQERMTAALNYFQTLPICQGFQQRLAAIQALLWLRTQQLPLATQWAENLTIPAAPPTLRPMDAFTYLVWARVQIAQKQFTAANTLLTKLCEWADANQLDDIVLEAAVLQALAAWHNQEQSAAHHHLQTVLTLAAPENHIRLFIDEGEPMQQLLEDAQEIHPYTADLLPHFHADPPSPTPHPPPASQTDLSPRELEVLQLIAAGRTNKEIAAQLFIAPSTAKRHTINIYNKLTVSNRAEATARAYELNLIKDTS